jgi:hypothetical protein
MRVLTQELDERDFAVCNIVTEQRHLVDGTDERNYWHRGQLVALMDVPALLDNESTPRH